MPHKRVSDDIDHVEQDQPLQKQPPGPPPEPWPMPEFEPLEIPSVTGKGNLPGNFSANDPLAIFELFFDDEAIESLTNHTNQYAALNLIKDKPRVRPWFPTTPKELRAYLAGYIWMGLHPEKPTKQFWNRDITKGPSHELLWRNISKERWQQIDRFFHISDPLQDANKTVFEKLEPLSEHLRQNFKKYWNTGTHLAVDETIERFMGRASEIVNIPNKPTPEGFKIWVMANQGYVLDWLYHTKGSDSDSGPVDLDDFWTKDEGFSKTQAVVLDLVSQEGVQKDYSHIIWLDNLFTSARLLKALKKEGFGAAGTVRTTQTKREKDEKEKGTKKQRKKLPLEENRGLDRTLSDLKLKHHTQLKWGELYGKTSDDGEVLKLAWKDQNVVLFMSTVHDGKKRVLRQRRRPASTSTNARTARAPFGDQPVKKLFIPEFINMYNAFMGGVDQADQLRSYYNTQRVHWKTWRPLFHFLLDTAITNAYKIAYSTHKRPWGNSWTDDTHMSFRQKLAAQLFDKSERLQITGARLQGIKRPLKQQVHRAGPVDHGTMPVKLGNKQKNCAVCVANKRVVSETSQRTKRKPLQELSPNTIKLAAHWEKRRRDQYPKGLYGCKLCNMHICKKGVCWNEHIEAVRARGVVDDLL